MGAVDPLTSTSKPLHFIAHSFGSAVTSEAVRRLATYQIPVDQVTYLDPHDFDQGLIFDGAQGQYAVGLPQIKDKDGSLSTKSYGVTSWANTRFTDVYYQDRGFNGQAIPDIFVPQGRAIAGAYNYYLRDQQELPSESTYDLTNVSGDHAYVWDTWYMGSVLKKLPEGKLQASDTQTSERFFVKSGFNYHSHAKAGGDTYRLPVK